MKPSGKSSFRSIGSVLAFFCAAIPSGVSAAPCCGGGQSQTTMILGDQRTMFSFHYLFSKVALDALDDGSYLTRGDSLEESQHSYILEGAYALTDRWQIGARLPVLYRFVAYEERPRHWGFGDALAQATWEALPEIRYSAWRPRVFLFSQWTAPLGDSAWESTRPSSSFSRGFWTFAAGASAVKRWSFWDASLSAELHRGLPTEITLADGQEAVATPGLGSGVVGSVGYRFDAGLRLGLTGSFAYESGVAFDRGDLGASAAQHFWSTSAQAGYSFDEDWTVMAHYTDQTLLGAARNVALSRIFGVTLQRSWER